jgi:hypothetical protein
MDTRLAVFSMVTITALSGIAADCGGGGTTAPPPKTGSISITGGYGATNGEQCAVNTSSVVHFKVTPVNLTGTSGIDTATTADGGLPSNASEVFKDIEGGSVIGCATGHTFFNLKPGSWAVQVSGGVPSGSCARNVTAGIETKVTIWQGVCL